MIKSISLVGNISDFSKMVLAIVVVIGSVFANIGIAGAVTANKLASSSALKDDVSGKENASNQYITGKYINEIVTQFLSVKGVEATPNLNPERMFRKCNGTLTVKPMFGNFQTVRVECEDTAGWRIAVRTKASSGNQNTRKTEAKTMPKMVRKVARNITPSPSKKAETTRVVSLTRSMTRGDIITPNDVTFIDVSMREVVGVFL
ncbi:MAG: hypothetical protein ACPH5J_04905, partial [Candidatus Puniceispirillum sp.]